MAKESFRALADEFAKRIPPKQTAFVDYFQKLQESASEADVDAHRMGVLLWLALMRPSLIPALSSAKWAFQFEESLIAALQKLVTHGSVRASDTFDLAIFAEDQTDGTAANVINLMDETMEFFATNFDARHSSPSVELKMIQFLLTAATSPNRAISGPHLKTTLTKLAEIFLFSKQPVNQNAAKAALTQIVNERMENALMDDMATQIADQEMIFSWLCVVIRNSNCPGVLAIIVLDLIIHNLAAHKELFTSPSPLTARISLDLAPALISSLNLLDDAIYDRCLQILELLVTHLIEDNAEMVEVLCVHYLAPPHPADTDHSPTVKGPLIKPHMRSFRNKIRSLDFANRVLFSNPQMLVDFFLNYDSEVQMSSVVETILEMVLLLVEVDWHRADGSRIPGSAFTDKDLALKLTCVELLRSFMSSVVAWHERLPPRVGEAVSSGDNGQMKSFSSTKVMKQALHNCVQMFNSRPQLGLDLAIKAGFVDAQDLRSHALWLRFTRGINKKVLGEYLGMPANSHLLTAFTQTFDFTEKSFVGALRMYLESFRIPGESQVIERFLETFSQRLVEAAPDIFNDADLLFQVSYSTLMLNTDMYSVNVKDKMSQNSFVKNTMGAIDPEKKLPVEVLHGIYEEIAMEEIQLCCQIVEHPLPLGFRHMKKWQKCTDHANGHEPFACLLGETFDVWARSMCIAIEKLHAWPTNATIGPPTSQFTSYVDFLSTVLGCFRDLFKLLCVLGLEKEKEVAFERLLATAVFIPNYDTPSQYHSSSSSIVSLHASSVRASSAGLEALAWLHSLTDELGSELGSSWLIVLGCISNWGFASLVDANHNIRELDLLHLDGGGVERVLAALLHVKRATSTQRSFVGHYGERIAQLPASQLERVIRHSYENKPVVEGFFSLLSSCAEDVLLRPFAFSIIQRLAREHMPLILSLNEKAMFGYLQSLEQFGLQSDVGMGKDAVETFVQIGNLVYSQHCAKGGSGVAVCDEDFFLKWYHVLSGLSRIAVEQPLWEASQVAMQDLFLLLKEQGGCYQEGHWRVIWRSVIFPLLEEVKVASSDQEMLLKLMDWSIELISLYPHQLLSPSIPEILDNILKYLEEISGNIASSVVSDAGLRLLQRLICTNYRERFEAREWQLVTETMSRIFKSYSPTDLHEVVAMAEPRGGQQEHATPISEGIEGLSMSESNLSVASMTFPERRAAVAGKTSPKGMLMSIPVGALEILARQCTMQLLFLEFVRGLTTKAPAQEYIMGPRSRMTSEQLLVWIDILLQSYEFAVSFNGNLPLRELMVQAGYADSTDLLILNRQETGSLQLLVEVLFRVYVGALLEGGAGGGAGGGEEEGQMPCLKESAATTKDLVEKYYGVSSLTLQRYVEMRTQRKVGKTWTELVMVVLKQWQRIPDLLDAQSARGGGKAVSVTADSSSVGGGGAMAGIALLRLGEEMVQTQVSIALEVSLVADRNSSMATLAKGYIMNIMGRLTRARLNSLMGGLNGLAETGERDRNTIKS